MSRRSPIHSLRLAPMLVAMFVLAGAGCTYPATELRVLVSTDVDPTVPLSLTFRAFRGRTGGRVIMEHTFQRARPGDTAPDAGFMFPASFTVVPGDTPHDGVVRIEVDADADGTVLHRVAVASFTPQRTGVLRLFLAGGCADLTIGCTGAIRCTITALCEQRGETCGDQGTCVPIDTRPSSNLDAGFDDIVSAGCGQPGRRCCGIGAPCAGSLDCLVGICTACPSGSEACCRNGAALANGSVCQASSDPCRLPGLCADGVCSPISDAPEGTECAAAIGPCGLPSLCTAGVCTARTAPDGTECGAPGDSCALPSTCTAGACMPRRAPDGTDCAPPDNPCALSSVCVANICTRRNAPDATVCAMGSGGCMRDGVCNGGACTGTSALPDGTVCAMAGNPCQRDGTCRAGACTGTTTAPDGTVCAAAANNCRMTSLCTAGVCTQRNVANGTVCAPTSDPCRVAGTCNSGTCSGVGNAPNGTVCVPQNTGACDAARRCSSGVCAAATALPNGTVCRAPANGCQLNAQCSGGTCPANPRRIDNYVLSASQRCCNGAPTSITTASNCQVCGLRCNGGSCVARTLNGGTRHLCTCSSNAQCSPLTTCRTQTPNSYVCSCNSAAECPGNAGCVDVSFNPNYCN